MDMDGWYSGWFDRWVRVTRHAAGRLAARGLDSASLQDLIETGEVRYKDEVRLWLYKHYPDRQDNLVCVAAVIEAELVVKTVMHYWRLEEDE